MKVWNVEYTRPMNYRNGVAIVLAVTAGDAIKKCCRKLRLGPHRVQKVDRVYCEEIVLK